MFLLPCRLCHARLSFTTDSPPPPPCKHFWWPGTVPSSVMGPATDSGRLAMSLRGALPLVSSVASATLSAFGSRAGESDFR